MDSFVSRTLRGIAHMTRLRGAETVIVGIQPEVAFAMVQLGMNFEDVHTALDLEEGLAFLQRQARRESRTPVADDVRVAIAADADVVTARQEARGMGAELGFSSIDLTLLATAISEVARNITTYARRGGDRRSACVQRARARRASRWWPATRARASPTSSWRCRTATRRATASGSGCPARAGSWTSSSSTRRRAPARTCGWSSGPCLTRPARARARRRRRAPCPGERALGRPRRARAATPAGALVAAIDGLGHGGEAGRRGGDGRGACSRRRRATRPTRCCSAATRRCARSRGA